MLVTMLLGEVELDSSGRRARTPMPVMQDGEGRWRRATDGAELDAMWCEDGVPPDTRYIAIVGEHDGDVFYPDPGECERWACR